LVIKLAAINAPHILALGSTYEGDLLEAQEVPGEFLEALTQMIRGFKKARDYLPPEDRENAEVELVTLIAGMIHSWMRANNIDPDQSAIRIEVEEEEIEVELPRRITRFRL